MLPPAVAAALLAPLEGMSARRRGREDCTAGTAWGMDWTFQFDAQISNKGLARELVCTARYAGFIIESVEGLGKGQGFFFPVMQN